jgi:hypothetical protein
MVSRSSTTAPSRIPVLHAQRRGQFLRLLDASLHAFNSQFDAFALRLVDALMKVSENTSDARQANLHFNAGNLLNNNRYVFFHVASSRIESVLRDAITALDDDHQRDRQHIIRQHEGDLTLVPLAEMDDKVVLGTVARQFDTAHAVPLNALTIRLSALLDRDDLTLAQNPFRPELWLEAMRKAWSEFDPDRATHPLIMPLLKPDVFLTLGTIFDALNTTLIAAGVLPDVSSAYRIHKSERNLSAATNNAGDSAIRDKLRALFSSQTVSTGDPICDDGGAHDATKRATENNATVTSLLNHLARSFGQMPGEGHDGRRLSTLKHQMPAGTLSKVDETTIDLLAHVFDSVFEHRHIPHEVKNLISLLQIPLLKTALADKNFFCSDVHPARKFIDLLGRASMDLDQQKGQDDPLYQTLKRTVERAHTDNSDVANGSGFAEAVSDLEDWLNDQETASIKALDLPITRALHGEKIRCATNCAKKEIAERIDTGEVVLFVEHFLSQRWVSVLTLAHSVAENKPAVLHSAINTMDDLLWSVKPKPTPADRKELIARLPTILGMLNKWLDVIQWNDAERLEFFADLAEAHASIVRAPLDLTPQRQLDIAIEAAKKSAERRLALRTQQSVVPPPDVFVEQVTQFERGIWLEFQVDGVQSSRLKLAWISPLRTLFIFSAGQQRESFSISADDLAQQLRNGTARVLQIDGIVDRALARALEKNDIADTVFVNQAGIVMEMCSGLNAQPAQISDHCTHR